MRKILIISSLVLLFFSCENTSSYKITGQISSKELDGKTIYLSDILSGTKFLDSVVVKDGKFEIQGTTDSAYLVVLSDRLRYSVLVFIESGNINVNIDIENPQKNLAAGTKLNDLYNAYKVSTEPVTSKLDELMQYARSQQYTQELVEEVTEKQKVLMEEMLVYSVKFLDENPGTILSAFVLANALGQGVKADVAKNAYEKLDEQVKNTELGKYINLNVEKMGVTEIAIGEPFRDLKLKTPDDKDISISDYAGKGKYVLLDFWASWCGPCRRENPNVVALYSEYKDKGFEIVGISLDQTKEAWIKGIEEDKITWPQMSDLKYWSSIAAVKYKVEGIPFTILLDKEGKVINVSLTGEALREKLKELMP
ncbi:MAG: AhpC/TSA family protein [Prevotellaceae bacterium]|nr:AhpC/TSA family protein [Prevotellaceae bacterium]